jgi:hypothetical protein
VSWQCRTQGNGTKEEPNGFGKKGHRRFSKEEGMNGKE